ncbi:MAG: nucleoside-diphosphate kinase [Planctomycetales bacterium 4484_113]|nr:MAG: nucleoside-diphosphate kinase [Planctomycetales bacterium 4484_113]
MLERTFLLIKPDGVQRGLVGEIISRIEKKGFKLVAMKLMQMQRELAEEHYAVHRGKDFYPELVDFITSGPVVAMVVEGFEAVRQVRSLVGATFPADADAGSIRGSMAAEARFNLVHASDAPETAIREIATFFSEEEIISYSRDIDRWLSSASE